MQTTASENPALKRAAELRAGIAASRADRQVNFAAMMERINPSPTPEMIVPDDITETLKKAGMSASPDDAQASNASLPNKKPGSQKIS